jgi:hypothetical protein
MLRNNAKYKKLDGYHGVCSQKHLYVLAQLIENE